MGNCGTGNLISNDIWFKYIPGSSGAANLATCGTGYDSVLLAYTGPCGNLSQIGFLPACCSWVTAGTSRPTRTAEDPSKSGEITPDFTNPVSHIFHMTVLAGTKRRQARVTGRIGYTPTTIGVIGSIDSS